MRIRALALCAACWVAGCSSGGSGPATAPPGASAPVGGLATDRLTINGFEFEVWLAQTDRQRQTGLMFATAEQMQPLPGGIERGMLFVFGQPFFLSFWMRNTFIPLDLAYIRKDGTIAEIHSMVPLDETFVTASEPVQFALEVNAGVLAAKGIGVGDFVFIPPSALP